MRVPSRSKKAIFLGYREFMDEEVGEMGDGEEEGETKWRSDGLKGEEAGQLESGRARGMLPRINERRWLPGRSIE